MNPSPGPGGEHDVEAALRASLLAHARHAPLGADLAERIIADADRASTVRSLRRSDRGERTRWRTWTMPLVAAGAVAAVIGSIVGISALQHQSERNGGPATHLASPRPLSTPSITSAPSTHAHSQSASAASTTTVGSESNPQLVDFRIRDVTFGSADEAWALGTADCLTGSGVCAALAHTSNGGTSWQSMPTPTDANVPGDSAGCATQCITSIRFANASTGYAFGPRYGEMTTDGGSSWTSIGGADALETLDGNVIRVRRDDPACTAGCGFTVQTATVGSNDWSTVVLPGGPTAATVSLTRTASTAFLLMRGDPNGSAPSAESNLYISIDDGASWNNNGEPCPQHDAEDDSALLTTAADGSITAVCVPRGGGRPFTATASGPGKQFVARAYRALGSAPPVAIGAASSSVLLISTDALYRSTDGGATWQRVGADSAGPQTAQWIGFESGTDARVIETPASGGSYIWTTHDAGVTWSGYRIG